MNMTAATCSKLSWSNGPPVLALLLDMPRPNAYKILKVLKSGDYTQLTPDEWKRDLSKLKMAHLRQVIQLLDAPNRQGEHWDRLKDICIEAMMVQNGKKFLT